MLRQLFYLPLWFFKTRILGKKVPLQVVLFITDHCNLSCAHCTNPGHSGTVMKGYEAVREELEFAYGKGARFVDFEGGEPMLWRDGERTVNDLVRLAKSVGFYSTTVTTNGQLPIAGCEADSIWVSVDGDLVCHDRIRGSGTFEILDGNIRQSGHKALSINMTINSLNKSSVGDAARYAKENPNVKQVSFNFHTPYPGVEDIMLPWEERCMVIDELLSLKRQKFPLMNSRSGLKIMKKRDFKKDCWLSLFILADGSRLDECPGRLLGVCGDCGFCMAGETYCVLRLKPDTIFSAIRLRISA
jgi:MoaA/NifB/PqqE/SkfB family radical SAM enzyme